MGKFPVAALATCNETEARASQIKNQIADFPWHTAASLSSESVIATGFPEP
jgi:hypothetical protein